MASRIVELRDALADLIETNWAPVAPSEVVAAFTYDVHADDVTGRKVIVFPEAAASFPATRGEDTADYGFQVWIVRRYEGQGSPPDDWVAAEIEFVEDVVGWVGDPRDVLLLADATHSGAYPQEADITTVYDVVDLIENKLFVAVATVLLREDADA